MSIEQIRPHQYNSATAPRQGGKAGRKNKISHESMRLIEQLLLDFKMHGKTAIDILRIEQPA
jgi:hypothetical protein